jgi:hypothetical protein
MELRQFRRLADEKMALDTTEIDHLCASIAHHARHLARVRSQTCLCLGIPLWRKGTTSAMLVRSCQNLQLATRSTRLRRYDRIWLGRRRRRPDSVKETTGTRTGRG